MRAWFFLASLAFATPALSAPREIIIDTDIGADIDDTFALALALKSPELKVDMISVSYGDTRARYRIAKRLLSSAHRADIPVVVGPETENHNGFPLKAWEPSSPRFSHSPDAIRAIIRKLYAAPPNTITLVSLSPLTTVGRVIRKDPAAFRRLKSVVIMSGSFFKGYGDEPGTNSPKRSLETNARLAPSDLRDLLTSGVPIEIIPVDASEVPISRQTISAIAKQSDSLSIAVSNIYSVWTRAIKIPNAIPTAFDAVPIARIIDPHTCQPHDEDVEVSTEGYTSIGNGTPNAQVCLDVDKGAVTSLIQASLVHQ